MKNPAKILRRQAKMIGEGIQESEFSIQKACLAAGEIRNSDFLLPNHELRTSDSSRLTCQNYTHFYTQNIAWVPVLIRMFFAPKGHYTLAQGNALGPIHPRIQALKGRHITWMHVYFGHFYRKTICL